MKKFFLILASFLYAANAFGAVSPDVRIVDNNGNVATISGDGTFVATLPKSLPTGSNVIGAVTSSGNFSPACGTIKRITSNLTTTIKSSSGVLHRVVVGNAAGSGGLITAWDNTAASGFMITSLSTTAVGSYEYNYNFSNGLTVTTTAGATSAQADITVCTT